MGSINLYKIDSEKQQEFFREISRRMQRQRTMDIEWEVRAGVRELFGFSLYTSVQGDDKQVGWKWVLDEFEQPSIIVSPTPKAIVVIEKEDEMVYAVTFGFSFFLVDKYCDRDFGFNFARKLTFKEIKTTTLTTPSSHRNKMVNTYINYNELEFDSGESFAKLKAKVKLNDEFDLYKPSIEIGNSIKFSTFEECRALQQ